MFIFLMFCSDLIEMSSTNVELPFSPCKKRQTETPCKTLKKEADFLTDPISDRRGRGLLGKELVVIKVIP